MTEEIKEITEDVFEILKKKLTDKGYIPITKDVATEYVPVMNVDNRLHNIKYYVGIKGAVKKKLIFGEKEESVSILYVSNVYDTSHISASEQRFVLDDWERVHIKLFAFYNKDYNPLNYEGYKVEYQIVCIDPTKKSDTVAYLKRSIGNYISGEARKKFGSLYDI